MAGFIGGASGMKKRYWMLAWFALMVALMLIAKFIIEPDQQNRKDRSDQARISYYQACMAETNSAT